MAGFRNSDSPSITPFLWFDDQAEEAARFYVSIFPAGKLIETRYYGEAAPRPAGSVMTVTFELFGQTFIALNGGSQFQFNPAVSFFVEIETQAEVDHLWDSLLAGGKPMACGWLTDKYSLSWQIVPATLGRMLQDKDKTRANRAMQAMMGMVKLDIAALERAYNAR
ncbi:MAG TPA: VOC family protein [Magnetospirillaceae bacterium]|jgi:predicted 3-demethylubiquinone-9 3-methyltransferase (glyoxalase superfamily)